MTLRVRGLGFAYPGLPPALARIDLDVGPGELVMLLGASGSGKSTLLRCVAGLERGYEGTVELEGRRLDALPPHERRVGMLFQEAALFPHLAVWRNVGFALRYRGVSRSQERQEALRWLEFVGLAGKAGRAVDALSGGERQRVALARTLAAGPRVVLLDEPLAALDRPLRDDLGPRVRGLLRQEGVAALWVTHDLEEARKLGDRALVLEDGRVRALER